jgi:ABC-2 type transport system ATP-binding protein
LLGPNGAGKTSLVRAVCGRLRLDGGSVRIDGENPLTATDARRHLGVVPQELALYSELTPRENLEIFARLMGLDRQAARTAATELLDRIGLADRADDRVSVLSGGMKRRLNVAAGVIHRPSVVLMDEPTVGVDPAAREDIHELLQDLRDDGMAILLTTHDLDQAVELADRVGILIDGKLRAVGSVSDLIGDAFGEGKELLVTLSAAPDAGGVESLESAGLTPSRDRRVWTRRLDSGLDDLSVVTSEFEAFGVAIEEVRVREPSLRGVFFRLAGREIDA